MRKGKLVAFKINEQLSHVGVEVAKVKFLGGDSTTLNTAPRESMRIFSG